MKILLTVLIAVFVPCLVFGYVTPDTITEDDGTSSTINEAGVSPTYGGDGPYESITCHITGTLGTLNLDIDGSLDDVTYFGMQDDVAALGGQSIVNQPFNYYQIDVDTCTACSITMTCQPVKARKR